MFPAYITWSLSNITSSLSKNIFRCLGPQAHCSDPFPGESPDYLILAPIKCHKSGSSTSTNLHAIFAVLAPNLHINKILNSDSHALQQQFHIWFDYSKEQKHQLQDGKMIHDLNQLLQIKQHFSRE